MFLDKLEMDSNDWFTKYLAGRSCWHRNFLFLLQFCSTEAWPITWLSVGLLTLKAPAESYGHRIVIE